MLYILKYITYYYILGICTLWELIKIPIWECIHVYPNFVGFPVYFLIVVILLIFFQLFLTR